MKRRSNYRTVHPIASGGIREKSIHAGWKWWVVVLFILYGDSKKNDLIVFSEMIWTTYTPLSLLKRLISITSLVLSPWVLLMQARFTSRSFCDINEIKRCTECNSCASLKVLCGSVDAVQLFLHARVCFCSSLVRAADLILQVVIRSKTGCSANKQTSLFAQIKGCSLISELHSESGWRNLTRLLFCWKLFLIGWNPSANTGEKKTAS